ncbi:uncharacterized protein Bfra_001145 [Botrytis fragariae]|uniref:Uncharacterized protein n=1 Tax=Botrytis fragariae TaxID=1964551 RepID=A0A8H6ENR5_9HELO|nr:uncharacterized protein Bfra_001145 [Botrytis fragariae]KAF5878972.1 hypothetical protein Bfra_001145 [Botrytis fragariae]
MFQQMLEERSGTDKCFAPQLRKWQCGYSFQPNQIFKLYRFTIVEIVYPIVSRHTLYTRRSEQEYIEFVISILAIDLAR